MQMNVGALDKLIRVFVGAILLSLVFWGPKTQWGWLGLVPLMTAALGRCPLYSILGVKTCGMNRAKRN